MLFFNRENLLFSPNLSDYQRSTRHKRELFEGGAEIYSVERFVLFRQLWQYGNAQNDSLFLGKFWMKLETSRSPASWLIAAATSNRVVSTGKIFVMVFPGICRRSRVSVYDDAGLLPPLADRGGAAATGGGAWPARSAFSRSDFKRLSSLSAAILSFILCLAAISSCFSFLFAAACVRQLSPEKQVFGLGHLLLAALSF